MAHPLDDPGVMTAVGEAAAAHAGQPWKLTGFTDLNDRASHPAALLHGEPFSIFAKLAARPPGKHVATETAGTPGTSAAPRITADAAPPITADSGRPPFEAELRGLTLMRRRSRVTTPAPVGPGMLHTDAGHVLLLEAVPEIPPEARSPGHWRSIGRELARLHQARHDTVGLADFDGFFGPVPQDNRPVTSNRWPDFYAERRLLPMLALAVDRGHLPAGLAEGVERVAGRLPALCGPEPEPALLHGDAQQNNFITTPTGAVLVDAAPYYGHPEVDLALLDYFSPVPGEVFEGYRELAPVDGGFAGRRELWRLFAYLAVVAVDGESDFGRPFIGRIADAVTAYR